MIQRRPFYKEISRKRGQWLKEFGGIKIYRDNFFVRPYGVPGTDTFDWLGLDARRAKTLRQFLIRVVDGMSEIIKVRVQF